MVRLIEATSSDLRGQVRLLVENYLRAMPDATRDTIVRQLIENSFNQPAFLDHGAGDFPSLNMTAIQVCYAQKAAEICKINQPEWAKQHPMWDAFDNYLGALRGNSGDTGQALDAFYIGAIQANSLTVLRVSRIWDDWGITRVHFEQLVTESGAAE